MERRKPSCSEPLTQALFPNRSSRDSGGYQEMITWGAAGCFYFCCRRGGASACSRVAPAGFNAQTSADSSASFCLKQTIDPHL